MKLILFFCALLAFASPSISQPKYEFRGVWIATLNNIDWPQNGEVNVASQKADFIRQLDLHKKNGMNAVIVQVRPSADAFYPSPYEPWSQWLTGTQGKAPSPYYDPLQFMIEETHKRNMEFHAWINPYRADAKIGSSSIAPEHITRKHPEWFLTYGDKKYFDPSNKEAQDFVVNVVKDIVKRYDVDGVHMDDYFYPYPLPHKQFPDEISYKKSHSNLSKNDWRRSNVDSIIKKLDLAIKKEKPWCKFGISPYSVWRNKSQDPEGSDTHAWQTNYDDLFADVLLWLEKGWIDYVAPQLYQEIGHHSIAYEKLVDWWGKHSYGRHVYIGHAIYRTSESRGPWKNPEELPNQIKIIRQNPNVQGSIFFSSNAFDRNPNGWNDSLRDNYYKIPALVPTMGWLAGRKISKPDSLVITSFDSDYTGTTYTLTSYTKNKEEDQSLIIYISPEKENVIKKSPQAIKLTVAKENDAFTLAGFDPEKFYKSSKQYFVAGAIKNKTGEESEISNIITVIKQKNGSYSFR
jgi:uncharacterized lipoprotein YddW (UPF0748 family)